MTSLEETQTNAAERRGFLAVLLVSCALAGCALAYGFVFYPLALGVLAGCALLWGAGHLVLGASGALAVFTMLMAFLLLKRFDEGLAIPLSNIVGVQMTFWMSGVLVLALVAAVFLGRRLSGPMPPAMRAYGRRFWRVWLAFVTFAVAGLALNYLLERDLHSRFLPAELVGLASICLPMLFGVLLAIAPISRFRTVLCLRALVGLGGMAGLIMAAFGLLPDAITGALGWAEVTGGTLDLVCGRLPLGHPNAVASVMLLVLPVAVVQGMAGPNILWRLFYLGCAALMFCGVLFALSRAALLNMVLVLGLTLAYIFFSAKERRLIGLVFVTVLGLAFAGIAGYLFSTYDFSRFWSRRYHEDASVERRLDSMTTALMVLRDHPVLGAGPDAVYPRLELRPGWEPPMQDPISPIIHYEGQPSAETPHNMYLHVFAEFGVLGGTMFFLLVLVVVWRLWRVRGNPKLCQADREAVTALLLGVVAFFMMGMFEALLMAGIRATLVFWVYAGLAAHYALLVERDAEQGAAVPAWRRL